MPWSTLGRLAEVSFQFYPVEESVVYEIYFAYIFFLLWNLEREPSDPIKRTQVPNKPRKSTQGHKEPRKGYNDQKKEDPCIHENYLIILVF